MQLVITIDTHFFRAYELKNKELTCLHSQAYNAYSESEAKEGFNQFSKNIPNLSQYEDVSCSFFSTNTSLIQDSIFSTANASKLLNFDHSKEIENKETDYNRIHEMKSVLLYWMPLWVKSVIVPKFPRVLILHEQSFGLKMLAYTQPVFNTVQLFFHSKHFSIQIFSNNQVVHNNTQEMQNVEDVLYHLVNCFERLKINTKTRVFIYNEDADQNKSVEDLKALLNRYNTNFELEVKLGSTDHLKFHQQCV